MILRIDKDYTYCAYNEEEPFFHDLLIDISNGKVSSDLNINGTTHNFTEFFLETSKGKTDVRISSLDFLDNNELEYIQEVYNYKEKEEFYNELPRCKHTRYHCSLKLTNLTLAALNMISCKSYLDFEHTF